MKMCGMWKRITAVRRPESETAVSSRIAILIVLSMICVPLNGCGSGGGGGTPDYQSLGVGMIIQSQSDPGSTNSTMSSKAFSKPVCNWKRVELNLKAPRVQRVTPLLRTADFTQSSNIDLTKYTCLFILAWDKVQGANHYKIFYQRNEVWDSNTYDKSADGDFPADRPQAYLDFDDELKDVTPAAGSYQFEIKALSGNNVIAELPVVTASLGMYIQSVPQMSFTSPNLTWDIITNATEYRITFDENNNNAVTVDGSIISGTTMSYNVGTKFGTPQLKSHDVWLDARYEDINGNPLEVSRGIYTIQY
ncbi:MAG TPA: hypothetical protein DDW65_09890 [Firmicutes bacterium]|jgi:hypothetical protein|nr:hypothetical protein [Bacillota bacterium]